MLTQRKRDRTLSPASKNFSRSTKVIPKPYVAVFRVGQDNDL